MATWLYRSPCGVPLEVEVEGEALPVEHGGLMYFPEEEAVDLAAVRAEIGGFTTAPARPSLRDRHFESVQACRWDPDAPRHGPTGKPRFDGPKEVREYVAKQRHRGLDTRYGEL